MYDIQVLTRYVVVYFEFTLGFKSNKDLKARFYEVIFFWDISNYFAFVEADFSAIMKVQKDIKF